MGGSPRRLGVSNTSFSKKDTCGRPSHRFRAGPQAPQRAGVLGVRFLTALGRRLRRRSLALGHPQGGLPRRLGVSITAPL
eukprot:9767152-Lingulodinium_polyedra.AAC.1